MIGNVPKVQVPKFENDRFSGSVRRKTVGEAKSRRVARVSSMGFEASFDRASEGRCEGRLTIGKEI